MCGYIIVEIHVKLFICCPCDELKYFKQHREDYMFNGTIPFMPNLFKLLRKSLTKT